MIGAFVPVASVAAAALSYGVADTLGGSGFLAVYLVGLAVGSTPTRYRRQLAAFHEGVAFVAQVGLFVLLGLLVFPHELPHVALPGIALALALMLVARPAAVWVSTAGFSYDRRDRVLLGWAGLRGAAPIVVATFVLESTVRHSESIFNIVFFVVVVSALVQGTTLERVAYRLGLTRTTTATHRAAADTGPLAQLDLIEFDVESGHAINGSAVRELGLPRDSLVAAIQRDGEAIPPRGSTIVRPYDRLYVLAPRTRRPDLDDVFARWRRLI
jgi:cell volume regulation protein A